MNAHAAAAKLAAKCIGPSPPKAAAQDDNAVQRDGNSVQRDDNSVRRDEDSLKRGRRRGLGECSGERGVLGLL